MPLSRFRFTIGQLIKLIAASAVGFAVLRTPYWPPVLAVVLAIGPCFVGFAIERAQGGPGIHGATFAGAIGFAGLGLIIYAAMVLAVGGRAFDLGDMLAMVLCLRRRWRGLRGGRRVLGLHDHPPLQQSAQKETATGRIASPIVWRGFEDRSLEHPQAGGHRA